MSLPYNIGNDCRVTEVEFGSFLNSVQHDRTFDECYLQHSIVWYYLNYEVVGARLGTSYYLAKHCEIRKMLNLEFMEKPVCTF